MPCGCWRRSCCSALGLALLGAVMGLVQAALERRPAAGSSCRASTGIVLQAAVNLVASMAGSEPDRPRLSVLAASAG